MYSVLYAHLDKVYVQEGQILQYGDKIAHMGNTGQSYGAHLHMGAVEGFRTKLWRLYDMTVGTPEPSEIQSRFFIEGDDLFKGLDGTKRSNKLTTEWDSPSYKSKYGSRHLAFDVVTQEAKGTPDIYWNRGIGFKLPGKVAKVGWDSAYGNYIIIHYAYGEEWKPAIKPGDIVTIDKAAADQIFGSSHLVIDGPKADGIAWIRIGVNSDLVKL